MNRGRNGLFGGESIVEATGVVWSSYPERGVRPRLQGCGGADFSRQAHLWPDVTCGSLQLSMQKQSRERFKYLMYSTAPTYFRERNLDRVPTGQSSSLLSCRH